VASSKVLVNVAYNGLRVAAVEVTLAASDLTVASVDVMRSGFFAKAVLAFARSLVVYLAIFSMSDNVAVALHSSVYHLLNHGWAVASQS